MKTEQLYNLFKECKGVSTDSRTVGKGQIFFALWGDNYNGNKFVSVVGVSPEGKEYLPFSHHS
jgi:UDP-N-acetylmuramyl pentapeptide synthase